MNSIPPVYNPNVPEQVDNSLSVTQPNFLNNFQALFNIFGINHNFATGNHTYAQLLEQINPQQTDVSQISIYTRKVDSQTDQIFFRYPGNQTEFQFTNYQIYSINPINDKDNVITSYFTFLPGGIIVYFGFFTKLKGNILPIMPAISKNIIAYSSCTTGSTPSFKSPIVIINNDDDYAVQIALVNVAPGKNPPPLPPANFLFLGNI